MGWKLKVAHVNLKPNEEKELELVLVPEKRAAIHGVVKFPDGTPVKNALVKLFKKEECKNPCDLIPITFSFTDECGQFLFGVPADMEFVVKVFFFKPEKKPFEAREECVEFKRVKPECEGNDD